MGKNRFDMFEPKPKKPYELIKGPTWEGHPDYVPPPEEPKKDPKDKKKRRRKPNGHDDSGTDNPDENPEKEAGKTSGDEKPDDPFVPGRNIPNDKFEQSDHSSVNNSSRDPEEYITVTTPTNKDKPENNPGKIKFPEDSDPDNNNLTGKKGSKGKKTPTDSGDDKNPKRPTLESSDSDSSDKPNDKDPRPTPGTNDEKVPKDDKQPKRPNLDEPSDSEASDNPKTRPPNDGVIPRKPYNFKQFERKPGEMYNP
jgi:hypothetical protein